MRNRKSVSDILELKQQGRKIVMVTAYDYAFAKLADEAGVDIILVGDSAAMVMMGYPDTRYITLDEMIVFCKSASRGVSHALVVGDMPFMSYQSSVDEAVRNAGRMVREGMVDAVKLEGGGEYADVIKAIVRAGIPVMAHVGLTPQSAPMQTGYRKKGKTGEEAAKIIEDAKAVEKAGAFSLVVEYTSSEVTKIITEELQIPVIGIGSGRYCDGQVLVMHDILGLYETPPKFAKQYTNLKEITIQALTTYAKEVREGLFPEEKHSFHMKEQEYNKLQQLIGRKT
ncbi:MAG TPA: 3-methyl-2-oxobutanoate hydroxymethyltransferase [Candidatus Caldiarchaeum subterraneum]|uniref:3-methyl-2-oxobutanoate hydroxymethyltransferase n=1 Tax=Caldiarchaeum subterraneum TaxID=311458 RepID=A0A832ZXD7_CALS0|nr:3-methyl-2-oxobutanoate hydroxymethyltransferase [Candidatus Caldarchaeum subterraneum]